MENGTGGVTWLLSENTITIQMVILSLLIAIGVSIVGILVANKSSGKMRAIAEELGNLSKGELKLSIDKSSLDRNDEIGLLADGAQTLSEKLGEVIKSSPEFSTVIQITKESTSQIAILSEQFIQHICCRIVV